MELDRNVEVQVIEHKCVEKVEMRRVRVCLFREKGRVRGVRSDWVLLRNDVTSKLHDINESIDSPLNQKES